MKRAVDLFGSVIGLVVLFPLMFVVGILVRTTHGSPILFHDMRMGKNDCPFRLHKFRTMGFQCDEAGALLPDGERLTAVGRWLRRCSLDELPELWNILTGEMSLVGPRPLPVRYSHRYTPAESRRHEVRPGLTGWAQVNGRNSLSWDDRLALDVWYVDHLSGTFDFCILWKTVAVVIRREGIGGAQTSTMTEFRPPPEEGQSTTRYDDA